MSAGGSKSGLAVGIDLGTTNSLCAVFEDGAPRLVPNAHGEVLTPSVVGVVDGGQVVVGAAAKHLALVEPDRTVATFKRWMGEEREVELAGHSFTPEQLSSCVLRALKEDAEAAFGRPVERAVVTVPAYFNEHQRRATRNAAKLADLQVDRILNEPTAAALSYGYRRGDECKTLLVFDLGGGTFDVTVMEIFEGTLEILATAGESRLGGEDFTDALLGLGLRELGMQLEQAEMAAPLLVSRLRVEAEEAKRTLATQDQAILRLPNTDGTVGEERVSIHAAEFEERTGELVRRLGSTAARALRDAGSGWNRIDDVLLVGGGTRLGTVRRLVGELFGRPPRDDVDPDQVVALGAAVQVALIEDDAAVDDFVMTDVCPFTLGTDITKEFGRREVSGYFLPVIHRNTTIPVSREESVCTLHDNQTVVSFGIYQGENRRCADNLKLGELRVTGLPPGPRGLEIAVRFTYDINGLLEVEAFVPKTGARFRTVLRNHVQGLSDEDVERAVGAMRELKFYPRDDLDNLGLIRFAEGVVGELDPASRAELETLIDAFERALDERVRERFGEVREALLEALRSLGHPYSPRADGDD